MLFSTLDSHKEVINTVTTHNWSFGERKKGQIQIILRPFSPSPSDLSLSATLTPTVVTLTDRHETDRQCNFGDIGR